MAQNTTKKLITKIQTNFGDGKHLPLDYDDREIIMELRKKKRSKSWEKKKELNSPSTPLLSKPILEHAIPWPIKKIRRYNEGWQIFSKNILDIPLRNYHVAIIETLAYNFFKVMNIFLKGEEIS